MYLAVLPHPQRCFMIIDQVHKFIAEAEPEPAKTRWVVLEQELLATVREKDNLTNPWTEVEKVLVLLLLPSGGD